MIREFTEMGNILAFDLGGTSVNYALVNDHGNMTNKGSIATPDHLEDLLNFIHQQVEKFQDVKIEGIAISSPGSVSEKGIIYGGSAIPYIHGPNIKALVKEATGLEVEIENDANCVALAEIWQGSAVGKKNVATVVLGTGIGGALIKDGVIHKGHHLHGGEFGYMIIDSRRIGSGMSTFSEVASTFSILKRVAYEKNIHVSELTGEKIFLQAEHGDEICKRAIEEFYQMLAIGIYNIQYIYDPEIILIGGGISSRDDLIEHIQKEVQKLIQQIDVAKVIPSIDRCYFRADANLIGVAYHFIQQQKKR